MLQGWKARSTSHARGHAVLVILTLRIATAVSSRMVKVNPIVGYLFLGMVVSAVRPKLLSAGGTVHLLAEIGVVFPLFDIGLSFLDGARSTRSGRHIRIRAASGQCVDDPNALGHWAGRAAAPARYRGDRRRQAEEWPHRRELPWRTYVRRAVALPSLDYCR
jgi:hypothetical protein